MKKLSKVDLLILDEFLLTNISEGERNDLFEVIQSRTDNKSTIYCSQWAPEGWLGKLGNGPLADAILDRIRNSSYTILFKRQISSRGLFKNQIIKKRVISIS